MCICIEKRLPAQADKEYSNCCLSPHWGQSKIVFDPILWNTAALFNYIQGGAFLQMSTLLSWLVLHARWNLIRTPPSCWTWNASGGFFALLHRISCLRIFLSWPHKKKGRDEEFLYRRRWSGSWSSRPRSGQVRFTCWNIQTSTRSERDEIIYESFSWKPRHQPKII